MFLFFKSNFFKFNRSLFSSQFPPHFQTHFPHSTDPSPLSLRLLAPAGISFTGAPRASLRADPSHGSSGSRGFTALILAAQEGHASVAKLLVDAGAQKALRRLREGRKVEGRIVGVLGDRGKCFFGCFGGLLLGSLCFVELIFCFGILGVG